MILSLAQDSGIKNLLDFVLRAKGKTIEITICDNKRTSRQSRSMILPGLSSSVVISAILALFPGILDYQHKNDGSPRTMAAIIPIGFSDRINSGDQIAPITNAVTMLTER